MANTNAIRGAKGLGVAVVTAVASFLLSTPVQAATATALVTVRVLGHADENVASGAVTVTKISDSDVATLTGASASRSGRDGAPLPTLSAFRVGGGRNATFAVSLPSAVMVRGNGGELSVSGFHATEASRRLSADGTAVVRIGASVSIPAGQAAGQYEGSYPITIAYN